MKKLFYIFLAVAIVFLGYRLFFSSPRMGSTKITYETIICFGDSLTYGTGAGEGMDYPAQLSEIIAKPVINAGVPGDTTAQCIEKA